MKTVALYWTLAPITTEQFDGQTVSQTAIHNFLFRSSIVSWETERGSERRKLIMITLRRQELNVLFRLDRYISLLDWTATVSVCLPFLLQGDEKEKSTIILLHFLTFQLVETHRLVQSIHTLSLICLFFLSLTHSLTHFSLFSSWTRSGDCCVSVKAKLVLTNRNIVCNMYERVQHTLTDWTIGWLALFWIMRRKGRINLTDHCLISQESVQIDQFPLFSFHREISETFCLCSRSALLHCVSNERERERVQFSLCLTRSLYVCLWLPPLCLLLLSITCVHTYTTSSFQDR